MQHGKWRAGKARTIQENLPITNGSDCIQRELNDCVMRGCLTAIACLAMESMEVSREDTVIRS